MTPEFWNGRRVLITGHTGFKGGWLSLLLTELGARVTGFALPPWTDPNLFELARIEQEVASVIGDVRDPEHISSTFRTAAPEVVIHMAAQPLVRASYAEPVETYATNVMGTVNVLEAARKCGATRAVVVVTTDHVYEPNDDGSPHVETDTLGGHDPYASSKACAELAVSTWRRSFLANRSPHPIAVASARAGNVMGGGDWAPDRLIPDLVRGALAKEPVLIRNPHAVRPWQHVLEPLCGYIRLVEELWAAPDRASGAWNFGPPGGSDRTVGWVADTFTRLWGEGASWRNDPGAHPYEIHELRLDTTKSESLLGWHPRLDVTDALGWTAAWYRAYALGEPLAPFSKTQVRQYREWNRKLSAVV